MNTLEKPSRPLVLGGITVKVVTGCGSMYVQLNWYKGRLFEVFATHGHGGGCAACEMEALTKSVTLGLKCGVPLAEYIDQLRGITCPNPMPFPKGSAVVSCPDGIAKTLVKYGSMPMSDITKLILDINGESVSGGRGSVSDEAEQAEAEAKIAELVRARDEADLRG